MLPVLSLGPIGVSTYYLLTSTATLVASLWFLRRASTRGLSRVTAIDLNLVVLGVGFIGARALHVLFEEPEFYHRDPVMILAVWNGGFVYLGGLVSALIAGAWVCRIRREPFWAWADAAALPAGLGYAIGRLGCFLNGCCYGRECRLPWAIHLHGADRHPTQLYAALWTLVMTVLLTNVETRFRRPGASFHAWALLFLVGRLLMEYFRDDPRGPAVGGLTLGTWMSLGLLSALSSHWVRQA